MTKEHMKWYLILAVAAAGVAAGVFVLDRVIGWGFFEPAESSRSQVQMQQPAGPGSPVAPSAPQRIETINYDAWTVNCRDTLEKSSKKICSGIMQIMEEKSRRVLMAWIIGRDNQGVLRTVIQTPPGVQIPQGLQLTLGQSPVRTLPYVTCEPQRCEASMAMDEAMVNDAIASQDVTAVIVTTDGRSINFKMQVKGIDKVLAAIGK